MKLGERKRVLLRRENRGHHQPLVKVYATGTVVYIHPLRRYYTLEFDNGYGKYREAFFFQEVEDEE